MSRENKRKGYIKCYRSLISHEKVGFKKPFSKAEAWLWLIANARFQSGFDYIDFGGKEREINTPRGSITHSLRYYAEAFGWSVNKVIRFFNFLENDLQIEQKRIQQITQLKIVNYDYYQGDEYSSEYSKGTAEVQQKNRINNGKNEKNGKNKHGEFVFLSLDEFQKLKDEFDSEDFINACIERLDSYIGSSGKQYRSHYWAIKSWVAKRELEEGGWQYDTDGKD